MRKYVYLLLLACLALLSACSASPEDIARLRAERRAAAVKNDAELRAYLEGETSAHSRSLHHPSTRDLDVLLDFEDRHFDLSLALWLFAKEFHDNEIDVDKGLKQIDNWRKELVTYVGRATSDVQRLSLLRTYIHGDLRFAYDREDPNGYRRRNLFMDTVTRRRRGYCVTLSMFYLLLAPSIGLEARGTFAPGHFGVLVKVDGTWVFVESTNGGALRSFSDIELKYRMSMDSREKYGVYLSPLSEKGLVSALYNNLGALTLLERQTGAGVEANDAVREEAIAYLRTSLKLSPKNTDARLNLATALAETRDPERVREALAEVNTVLKWDANSYNALVSRAAILHRYGDPKIARDDLRRAKSIMPKRAPAYVIEGNIAANEERWDDAKKAYDKALDRDPNDYRAMQNLAIVESNLGNKERAGELRERAKRTIEE